MVGLRTLAEEMAMAENTEDVREQRGILVDPALVLGNWQNTEESKMGQMWFVMPPTLALEWSPR
jgi:hypothetical protein